MRVNGREREQYTRTYFILVSVSVIQCVYFSVYNRHCTAAAAVAVVAAAVIVVDVVVAVAAVVCNGLLILSHRVCVYQPVLTNPKEHL